MNEWRTILIALIGGLLGWALGKVLDSYLQRNAVYFIVIILAVAVLILAKG